MSFIRKTKQTGLTLAALAFALALAACGGGNAGAPAGADPAQGASGGAAEPEKVVLNIGVQGKTGILPYAREKGLFEKSLAGLNIEVKWHEFASGPPHFEAIAAGRLDVGSVGGTPVISGQVGGVDFRAIAVVSDGRKGNSIVIPKDSPIKTLEDLKGKKIGVAKGSSAYNFLYMAVDHAGLTEKDIQIIQLQPDEARPALDSGAIDAWSIWEPYATTAVFQVGASILATGADLNINAPSFLIARTEYTEKHPEATVAFLKAYEEARLYYTSHLEEVAEEISEAQKLDIEIIRTVLKNSEPILSPVTPEFAEAHQAQADFLYSVGGIDKQLDTSKVLESKFVEQALAEIKK
jgi:sulfonate transport system substrate-binding protein